EMRCAGFPARRRAKLLRLGCRPEEERPPLVWRAGGDGCLVPGDPALRLCPGRQACDADWCLRVWHGHLDLKGAVLARDDLVGGAGVRVRLDHGAATATACDGCDDGLP